LSIRESTKLSTWRTVVVCFQFLPFFLSSFLPFFIQFESILIVLGQSALFCAARQGNIQILEQLLNLPNIDLNVQVSEHGGTPLHCMLG
jgi:hypothetical protein